MKETRTLRVLARITYLAAALSLAAIIFFGRG